MPKHILNLLLALRRKDQIFRQQVAQKIGNLLPTEQLIADLYYGYGITNAPIGTKVETEEH